MSASELATEQAIETPAIDTSDEKLTDETNDVKHPLEHRWSFWYNPPNKVGPNGEWTSNTKKVVDFDSVEDFWRLFNVLKTPSQLTHGSNYHLFKHGIEPEWEHELNKDGGKWIVALPKKSTDPAQCKQIDESWMYALLALIGEQFVDSDEICGIVISPRNKGDSKLALWTRNAKNAAAVKRIGQTLKETLGLTASIQYSDHAASMASGNSFRNPTVYTL